MKLKQAKKTATYSIENSDDLYDLQIGIKEKGRKIKWVAQELANNIVEYEEKGKILINGNSVVMAISIDSITEEKIQAIRDAIALIKKQDRKFNPKGRNNYSYGGLGFLSISKMGFKFKMYRTKNNILIVCRTEGEKDESN